MNIRIVLLILVVFLVLVLTGCYSTATIPATTTAATTTTATTPTTASESSKQIDALVESQLYAKSLLKSPGTAKFPLITADDIAVKKTDDNTYLVAAYVDSENSFGAVIRTYYICYVVFLSNDTYQIKDFEFIES